MQKDVECPRSTGKLCGCYSFDWLRSFSGSPAQVQLSGSINTFPVIMLCLFTAYALPAFSAESAGKTSQTAIPRNAGASKIQNMPSQKFSGKADALRGAKLFEKATCSGCHPGGSNLLHPSKPLKGKSFAERYKDDSAIEKVIRSGVPNTGMPAFDRSKLSNEDLRAIVTYIRSLNQSKKR